MKRKREILTIIFMTMGVIINYLGKTAANVLNLPLWLDSIGTAIVACVLGPVYGALCGGLNNAIYGMVNPHSYAYGITSVAIGIVVGVCMKRGYLKYMFGAFSVSVLIAFIAVIVSTPLNFLFGDGSTGNVWGDGLYGMLKYYGFNAIIASFLSEFFIDFPDKIVTILIAYGFINIPVVANLNLVKVRESKNNKERRKRWIIRFGNKTNLFILLFLLSAAGCVMETQSVSAKDNDIYAQRIYNNESGLSAGEANDVAQTNDGYMWIGTYAGLYRYDGNNFEIQNYDSVKNVNKLYVDEEGRMWIGTNDNGISLYVKGKISNIIDKSSGLSSNSVRSIEEDSKGNYYIGTSDSMCIVSICDGLSVKKKYTDILYADNISVRDDDTVAVVTNEGMLAILKDTKIIGKYKLSGNSYYTSCLFDDNGQLLLGTSANKIYKWDFKKQSIDKTSLISTGSISNIHSMKKLENDEIWVCSDTGIGYIKENGEFEKMKTSSFNSSIDNMTIDYQGNLWFASSRLGLLELTQNIFTDEYNQYNLSPNVVNSTVVWNGKLYSGTDVGLDIIDEKNGKTIENSLTRKLKNNRVRCLKIDKNNHLWISTSEGIGLVEVYPDGTIRIYGPTQGTVDNRFRSTLELSDGTIAAAENTGIDFIKNGKVVGTIAANDGLSNPQILSMIEKSDGTLMAGSDGDGIVIIKNKKIKDRINEDDGLPSGVILRMIKDGEGYLIVTSNSLCYIDNSYKITVLKNFPYSNNYDAVLSDDGSLWVFGSAGVYITDNDDLLSNKKVDYEILDNKKGLSSSLTANAWNYIKDGKIYLSCNTGVYLVNMNNYSIYDGSYRMMIDYVEMDGQKIYVSKSETTNINSGSSRIMIKPVILNYTLDDPYISYYLEGFDKKPTIEKQSALSTISYTNLSAGKYVFHISILDNSKKNVLETNTYEFEKKPFFWQHNWFYAYLIFVCVLVVAYITWLVTIIHSNRIIVMQNKELELARKQAEMGNETILAIAKTVDAKDVNTSKHSERVSEYSVLIAQKLGWTEEECDNIRRMALLHDIGKIGIPDSILNKPSKLTEEEYAMMKSHVTMGAQILKDFTLIDNVCEGVEYHHERFDGKGYVKGLKGEEIPINARIICIADAFDAMTSNRVYRKQMDMDYVMRELRKGKGTQFDPELVTILIKLVENGEIGVGDNHIMWIKKDNNIFYKI